MPSTASFHTGAAERSLFGALLDAREARGEGAVILNDMERQPLTFGRLVLASLVLGRALTRISRRGEAVGVMLPNANGLAVTFFALHAYVRVPAMINYTAGAETILAGCAAAGIKTILTSRRFIAKAKLEPTAERLAARLSLLYLEDIRQRITTLDKALGWLAARVARRMPGATASPREPAVILFTSGSEGVPKGVALSHANILANCAQVASVVDFSPDDRLLNTLPVFHCFGITGGLLLPVFAGVPTFQYPNPLHYKAIADLVRELKATILFGTDTFLTGYARAAAPEDFASLRYVFAGAERVREETHRVFRDKYGLRIFEGYGTTETAPVLAVNTPAHYRPGTVGPLLPGIECRLEPMAGARVGARLQVKGPNVMLGYLKADKPGVVQPPPDGWHDTGDIVEIDADGFVHICGRARRFAKIGGEMVSLAAVEGHVAEVWPEASHAVASIPDLRKGEQLVLVTTQADADRTALLAHAHVKDLPELTIPRTILVVDEIPILGTGKTDYPGVQKLVAARMGSAVPR
ncbi:MAG TPA: AMP-binding protein [Azospirillaceae bacterium]|nr:AMP-binding protein [Azospirillaceae bacterium]